MMKFKKIAYLFPGQGAQYSGMGKDFAANFSAARLTYEEADQILNRPLSQIIFNGPDDELTETRNSQLAIFVTSMAIFRVFQELSDLQPTFCAGLSLGEYSALVAANWISFIDALPLVQMRGELMNEACELRSGKMAVVMGLDSSDVENLVGKLHLPQDLWVANYNCPGQVVLSGTEKGILAGMEAAKEAGAKRVLPLAVHGAFHSGLMESAEKKLAPYIDQAPFNESPIKIISNVTGNFASSVNEVRANLTKQVSNSVRWEQGIRAMEQQGVDLFVEFGPGKTLSGMNKRIGVKAPIFSIDKLEDLDKWTDFLKIGE
jgi:[acyl-carrier-protein] S-malonyltransferase